MMDHLERAADEFGRTILVVLHDSNIAARYADRICAVKDGGVVRWGTPAESMRDDVLTKVFDTPIQVIEGPRGPPACFQRSSARPTCVGLTLVGSRAGRVPPQASTTRALPDSTVGARGDRGPVSGSVCGSGTISAVDLLVDRHSGSSTIVPVRRPPSLCVDRRSRPV